MTSVNPEEAATRESRGLERPAFDILGRLVFGAAAFQTLRAACETGLLEQLIDAPDGFDRDEIGERIGLRGRWLDTLLTAAAATELIRRGPDGRYLVAAEVAPAVRSVEWSLFTATVAFEHHFSYRGISMFTEALVRETNAGIENFPGHPGDSLYVRYASDPQLRQVFYTYMRAWSRIGGPVLWDELVEIAPTRMLDIGGGDGVHAIATASRLPGLEVTVLDLPENVDVAQKRIAEQGLADRIRVVGGDMFVGPFPEGHDLVLFAHQLVIWTEEENLGLLRRTNAALPLGGTVVIFSSMTDDTEDGPFVAAMASLYHTAIPVEGGRIYPWSAYEDWLTATGFGEVRRIRSDTWTPHGVIVARKVADI
ncbi:O-methyltransferase [Sinomonas cellulolyticus]|uniref:Methyltransferase domain-containing protein n=1 Tax=Sinomonas cellulolyticus TaxID=2801916 RepID=A0ABS1K498_9MICC|nr:MULTISPECIES: methyltransferase [Sinomonas]MBL0705116.1 methyltransferase domain-containing protein [Sinomonas cellulolyticus]GHG60811.1 O-methyltransferase [Sinomonas sp. KCTC 49339]